MCSHGDVGSVSVWLTMLTLALLGGAAAYQTEFVPSFGYKPPRIKPPPSLQVRQTSALPRPLLPRMALLEQKPTAAELTSTMMEQVGKLHLRRPLVFFDLETTGTKVGVDRIVEMAMIKLMPDGTVIKKPEHPGKDHRMLVNPEMPIPVEASLVHGVYDKDVQDAPTFGMMAPGLSDWLHGCDLGGFNSNRFDVPMLAEEFLRVGVDFGLEGRCLIDVQSIFHRMEQRTLRAALKFYCDKDLEDAHEAMPDTLATVEVFFAQLDQYKEKAILDSRGETVGPVPSDMEALGEFCRMQKNADLMGRLVYDDNGEVVFKFGKHFGKRVRDVLESDASYVEWIMQADFPRYTKRILQKIRDGEL